MRDRVVDFRRVKARDLRANAQNWRLHPEAQKSAMRGMLDEVGFVGAVLARQLGDGTLELLDGHLRADLAADDEVPVVVVDLDDKEAAKVLATYDPISGMALVDDDQLAALLDLAELDDHAELRKLLTDLQGKLAKEEDTEEAVKFEVPGMALQPHEHYDYLVVLATTSHEWNVICDRLGMVPEKRRGRLGTCRAIRADKLLAKLRDDK